MEIRVTNDLERIVCKSCGKQNLCSSTTCEEKFGIHKADIKVNTVRCRVARHLLNIITRPTVRRYTCKFNWLDMLLLEILKVLINFY